MNPEGIKFWDWAAGHIGSWSVWLLTFGRVDWMSDDWRAKLAGLALVIGIAIAIASWRIQA